MGHAHIVALVLCALIASSLAVQYPLDASWFANRWTSKDWNDALSQFQSLGGSTVWQRGNLFRLRSPQDILQDPDFVWCWALDHCIDNVKSVASSLGVTIVNWFTYQNDEDYDAKAMIRCPKLDIMINTSRIYYRMLVPHDSYNANWDCTVKPGMKMDVVFTEYAGTDPHDFLMHVATERNMSVDLPMPSVPDSTEYWPAYFEFTRRVLDSYSNRFGKLSAYKGVYQTNEACLCDWYQQVAEANAVISGLVHSHNKRFVISPYIDLNLDQVKSTVAKHKEGFKVMARSGADIIAVQEGRGCAKGCYWWNYQLNETVAAVDPVLDQIVKYLAPNKGAGRKYAEVFSASNQQVFHAFDEAVVELKAEGVTTELWLNVEAFEYLRDYPCLPVDKQGNGMAELLDRTTKSRIDWALTAAGGYPTKVISFAWDADYLCVPEGTDYTMSLADEIYKDWRRPIVSYLDRSTGLVRGYNLVYDGAVQVAFDVTCSSGKTVYGVPGTKGDQNWGSKNNKQPLLSQVFVEQLVNLCPASDQHVCVVAVNTSNKLRAYHEYCHEK